MELNEKRKIHKRISKALSLVLRHKPEVFGITLDGEGWTPVPDLIRAFNEKDIELNLPLLQSVVAENDKQRFSFNEDQTLIRANQGHSVQIDLSLKPVQPPDILYHGTVEKFLDSIRQEGLQKMSRQHVHLSTDIETARKVGGRRGKPVILKINSGEMYRTGYLFYQSENGVWLTDHVIPTFISFD